MRFVSIRALVNRSLLIRNFSESGTGPVKTTTTLIKPANKIPAPSPPTPQVKSVPGLSAACVKSKSELVGPGASATAQYKVPEYFCYDKSTYFEAEVEMASFRLPQPSAK